MCACDEGLSFVCSRCAGTPHDPSYLDDEPESTDELRERLTQEHSVRVVQPALNWGR